MFIGLQTGFFLYRKGMGETCWGLACPNLGYARKKNSEEDLAFKTLDLALIFINIVADIKVLDSVKMLACMLGGM